MNQLVTIIVDSEQRREYAIRQLQRLPLGWDVQLSRHIERRTNTQNARLWKLHTLAGNELGYAPEEMHELALCRHFGYQDIERTDPLTGAITSKRAPNKRSSPRDKKEFGEFMEATETWYITDFGVFLDSE
jgi:hypothetical protein